MPQVIAQGKLIECESQANLRKVLLANGVDLYNGGSGIINCRGIGTCGTCAVKVEGEVSAVNWRDQTRRSLPPHSPTNDLRLACQTQVLGNVKVTKFNGFWGQGSQIVWTPEG
ncbi:MULTISPECIES: 2Fe-2S iron-sulfur cluster-binding protein [unclassified Anabaena]|uniref:2Fe-2S iron-sulfur cluster-binding protein n=1 Tax=unclassified Anabaena TaxID=2619674 RepID=UPI00144721FE|nr:MULTISPECIES: 2Fe-2S iron-sulfur cluster-binding protein [unclassified Anabaena]MTJ09390.1 (2Fe-2S)-binding protein [Anabaena sp. UHCC 0204]MTJ55531.1 (2Fe-2S)-binding protein [Anabaena sp. UHCC 0253]